jgi:hypothetical protein
MAQARAFVALLLGKPVQKGPRPPLGGMGIGAFGWGFFTGGAGQALWAALASVLSGGSSPALRGLEGSFSAAEISSAVTCRGW